MDLVAQVLRALDEQPIDPTEFERCASALLQTRYPGLSAVEGGHDFGRDGDIYLPFRDDDTRSRGRLLVTTGDPVANMRTGLRRMLEENLQVDLVVMACSLPVNATVRARLDELCADHDLPPPHVYARNWLVGRLVREPEWRLRLLGVRGQLGALLTRPLEMLERAAPEPPDVIGRAPELSELQPIVGSSRDVVLVGVPGVGKTRLVAELEGSVMFLQTAEPGQIVDALVRTCPSGVVVDDAHDRLGALRVLRQARVQEGLSFSIIATTWPDRAEEVQAGLVAAETVLVDRLELTQMDAIVRSVGVTGHRARALVLRQADGRPGWALTLCEVLLSGNAQEIVTGSALLANAERFLRRVTESETTLDALACIAAVGDGSPETVHRLAPLIGAPAAQLIRRLDQLAHNGLVERNSLGWRLQPALHSPLITRWFFTQPAGRPWSTLINAFSDHILSLTSAAITAARMGAPNARPIVEAWAQSASVRSRWSMTECALLAEYATLDEDAAQFATTQARAILAANRPVEQLRGISYDPVGQRLRSLLKQVARQWLLSEAVFALLDLAVGDTRPRPSTSEHPLRTLGDLAREIDPDYGTDITIRERLLDHTLTWLVQQPRPDCWTTAAELITKIFSPETSGHWLEPGSSHTLTMSSGVESAANLERLLEWWDRVDRVVIAAALATPSPCPPEALALLIDVVGEWLRLGAGIGFVAEVPEPQQQVGQAGALRFLESLRLAIQRVPGLALRAQRLLDYTRTVERYDEPPAPFKVDADLRDLVGGRVRDEGDVERYLRNRRQHTEALAQRLTDLGPEDGTARLAYLISQAQLAGNGTEFNGGWVANLMRTRMDNPHAWFRAAEHQHMPSVLRAAFAEILDKDPTHLPPQALDIHLHDPAFRPLIISTVLARSQLDTVGRQVIADLNTSDVGLLEELVGHQAPDEVLHQLLRHPIAEIAGATALNFAVAHRFGPELPDEWRHEWTAAIRNLRVDHLDQHIQWQAGELLKHLATHEPDLLEDWFKRRLDEMSTGPCLRPFAPMGAEDNLVTLPQPHRERLARQYATMLPKPRLGQTLLTNLVGTDRELAQRLLNEHVITPNQLLEAITGQRNTVLEELGPLLLERGVDPAHIASCAGVQTEARFGHESTMHAELHTYFNALGKRIPKLQQVADAGCAEQHLLRDSAEQKERQERIRGG